MENDKKLSSSCEFLILIINNNEKKKNTREVSIVQTEQTVTSRFMHTRLRPGRK